jgi:CubicO group peptidase (beta-lactamase class C family)
MRFAQGMAMALLCCYVLRAAEQPSSKQMDNIFARLASANAPGGAVMIIDHGRIVFQHGYGVTDVKSRRPIDVHTNFRLASDTKQFTAMAVMLLVHDGKLHYEDRLADILPEFPAYARAITVRNLLNHTSGLPDYEELMPKYDKVPADEVPQIQDGEVLKLLEQQKTTKFPPGSKWEYSNSGYVVLGSIVAKLARKSFPEFLQERIFRPLGMNSTVAYVKGKNEIGNRAYGHSPTDQGWEQTDQSPTSATLGDGGVYSSLTDLAKWDDALRHHRLLREDEMRPAITPVKVPGVVELDGKPAAYGFGWFLNDYRGHRRMWHYGETMGFRSAIQRFVDDQLTVVVLLNRTDVDPTGLALKAADLYLFQQ